MEYSQDNHLEVEGVWYHQEPDLIRPSSKLDDQTKRRLIGMATKRPMAALKVLQSFMAKTGHCVHVTTISQALYKSGLYGRVARRKTLLKKNPTLSQV